MTTQTKSLYHGLGGGDAINALTESWVTRVGGDDRANGKFARTDIRGSRRRSPTSCARPPAVPAPTPAGACGRRTPG